VGEIALCAAAPAKPRPGQPCNGCGVCCVVETCPVGRIAFLKKRGPCPALAWQDEAGRYLCGLVQAPAAYLSWLPVRFNNVVGRLILRSIAAGSGCDCEAELLS
jgi:hypothetical protein